MSKLNAIQAELIGINQAKFQELCDAYIYKKFGFSRLRIIGSMRAKEKTAKGTPDTLFQKDDKKVVFAEYTTQKGNLFNKFSKDLDKCFDEKKTRIPVANIEKIFLGFNGELTVEEEKQLIKKGKAQGVKVELLDMETLSFDLYLKFPKLAYDFLNIEVDTGQILSAADFVQEYQKNRFATRLTTTFRCRARELVRTVRALENHELVIVSGKAGIGKTRLVLAALERFVEKNPEYKSYCIYNREGISLFNDLKDYFSADGNYLIFVDDANRISELQHILSLLNEASDRKKYKIIATVRDYDLVRTKESAKEHDYKEIILQPFDGKKLKTFLASEFGITNPFYVERIEKISEGNPRIAVMAAEIAKKANRLDSIFNVSEIYDEYFASIAKDLSGLENRNLLKVAGILSFFRVINFQNHEPLETIGNTFGLNATEVFENAVQLSKMEVADFHENEIVKISDQILATYLFYKVFFKDNLLDFFTLLNYFFGSKRNLLIDAVYPAFDVFDRKFLRSKIQPAIDKKWEAIKDDEIAAFNFIETFFPFIETESLIYLKKEIDTSLSEPFDAANIKVEPDKYYQLTDKILRALLRFRGLTAESFGKAADLMLAHVEKHPSLAPQLVHLLLEELCFERDSHLQAYAYEKLLIEKLVLKARKSDRRELFKEIFLKVAGRYLGMEFRSNSSKKMTFIMHTFGLEAGDPINDLRAILWNELFGYFAEAERQNSILKILSIYSGAWRENDNVEIARADAEQIIPFIESNLDPINYAHCCTVQDYTFYLEKLKIPFPKELKERFQTKTYEIAEVVFDKRHEIYRSVKADLGYATYEKHRTELLKTKIGPTTTENYVDFLEICLEISYSDDRREAHRLNSVLPPLLIDLAKTDRTVFVDVVEHIFETGNPFNLTNLGLYGIVREVTNAFSSPEEAYDFLRKYDYNLKELWLHCFFATLAKEEINEFFLDELLMLYQRANLLVQDLEYLEKYAHLEEKIFIKVVEIVWRRVMDLSLQFSFFYLLYGDLGDKLNEIFADDLNLLKRIYYYQQRIENYEDYDRKVFKKIYKMDPDFALEYLKFLYDQGAYLRGSDANRDYDFIWESKDCEQQMRLAIQLGCERRRNSAHTENYVEIYFGKSENEDINKKIRDFLKDYIRDNFGDFEKIKFVFEIVADTPHLHSETKDFLEVFLEKNKNFEDFRQLSYEPNGVSSWIGSPISMYQREIVFYQSLLPLVEDLNFIEHKNAIEKHINSLRKRIENALIDEFVESAYR